MKKIIILFLLISFFQFSVKAQEVVSSAFKAAVEEYFTLSNVYQTIDSTMDQMMDIMRKQTASKVNSEFWTEYEREVKGEFKNNLLDSFVPLYQKYYTLDDMQELIAFYKSPIGRKMAAKNPEIMKESMLIGQEWGMRISKKIISDLKAKGYMNE